MPKAATIKASKHNVEIELSVRDFELFVEAIKEAGGVKVIDGVVWKVTEE